MANPTTIDELQLYFDLCTLSRQDRQEILAELQKHLNERAGQTPVTDPEAVSGTE